MPSDFLGSKFSPPIGCQAKEIVEFSSQECILQQLLLQFSFFSVHIVFYIDHLIEDNPFLPNLEHICLFNLTPYIFV